MIAPTSLDQRLFDAFHGSRADSALTVVMVAFTLIGSGWTMFALVPLFASRRARPHALGLGAVWIATAFFVFLLKDVVGRARPCVAPGSGGALWGTTPTDYSFPSGHAAGAFAFAAFVAVLCLAEPRTRKQTWRWAVAAAAFACAACIALSRVYLGVHFPTDVVGGALLGGVLGGIGAHLHRRTLTRPRGG